MSSKSFFSLLTGLAAGVALGLLFAPEKGEKTRKKVMEKLDEWEECLRAEKAAAEEESAGEPAAEESPNE